MPWTKHLHNQPGKGLDYRKIGDKFGDGTSTACEKSNTVGTDGNLFRLVPVLWHGTRVPPLELVPLPGHGAQISNTSARAKGNVQTARAPSLNAA